MTKFTKSDFELKEELYQFCSDFVDGRWLTIQNNINAIQESLTSETKSSAGDKHETGRAMLQLEREKSGQQLSEVEKLKEVISKIDINKSSKVIGLGSIAFTNQANYFIAISAGEIKIKNINFFAISPQTPIGQLLLGKTDVDEVIFRNLTIKILNVI